VPRARDDDPALHAKDFGRLAQHHFDLARVPIPLGGEVDGLGPRVDGRKVDNRALGLGNDLLRHDQHVTGSRREIRIGGRRRLP
jgi:hypothetical protein